MRIAVFSETFPPDINGVATHVYGLYKGLKAHGCEVMIVHSAVGERFHSLSGEELRCPALRLKRLCSSSAALPFSRKRFRLLKAWKPDIIHIHNEFGIGISGRGAAKRLGLPYIYTLHTMYDGYMHYIAPPPLRGIAARLTAAHCAAFARDAAAVVGASPKIKAYLPTAQVHLIPNALPDGFLPTPPLKRKQGITRLCFCGRLGKEKGLDVLFSLWNRAVDGLEGFSLLIIGDGPCRSKLEAIGGALFVGAVEHEKIPSLYGCCDAYITASLSENHSIAELEALACGLPIFHLPDKLNEHRYTDGLTGFRYSDSDELRQRLRAFASLGTSERAELSECCRKSVTTSSEYAAKLLQIYKSAIAHKRRVR